MLHEDIHRLDTTITLACSSFVDEGHIEEMFSEAKVFWIGKVAKNLHERVMDLESQVKPRTSLDVLAEWRKVATEAVTKIEEVKELRAKAVEQVSLSW